MSTNLPLQFTAAGPVPTPPSTLQQVFLTQVAASVPGYTANLPGLLIEDLSSTAVGALSTQDQARVDAVNNVSPLTANAYILNLLGQMFGIPIGLATNGSVYEVFSGPAGTVIAPGWTVTDGTNQYVTSSGGVIGSSGQSTPILFVATNSNVFAIPANSVNQSVTTLPSGVTVTNPTAGTAASSQQTVESYRAQVTQAYQAWGMGVGALIKSLLAQVPGVNSQLTSVIQNGTKWEVVVGGTGDENAVAMAIYTAVSSVGLLTGSSVSSGRNVTVSISDPPNTYSVVYVAAQPPAGTGVTIAVTWNTDLSDFTASAAVNQLILAAVPAYVNSLGTGQPINELVLTNNIQSAVAPVLAEANLSTLSISVAVNGVTVSPTAGTSLIPTADNETYWYVAQSAVTSNQA